MNSSSQHHGQGYKVVVTQCENKFFCLTSWLRSDLKLCHFCRETFQRVSPEISQESNRFFSAEANKEQVHCHRNNLDRQWTLRRMGALWRWLGFEEGAVFSQLPQAHKTLPGTSLPDCRRENSVGGSMEESTSEITWMGSVNQRPQYNSCFWHSCTQALIVTYLPWFSVFSSLR